ncbi:hypothetical protein D9M72_583890 [compost metagenome]
MLPSGRSTGTVMLAAAATGLPLCVSAMVGTFSSRASVKARTSSALRPEKDEPMSTSVGRAAAVIISCML